MAMGSYEFGTSVSLAAVVSPSTTVFMTDGGSTVDLSQPITKWENASRESDWLLIDPANEPQGCTNCLAQATTTDPTFNVNIGGPVTRHLETSVVGFMDGHVKAMKAEKWYYASTPWLDPARGGA